MTLFVVGQLLLTACASTKTRDEQGPIGKLWHNMNSHYNGYFNARELMDEALVTLEVQHTDDYTKRLDMFPFLAVDDASIVKDDMDKAIEKVAVVTKKHPYSNWVDDCYLLYGQAELIKQDYESAERILQFAVNEFRPRPKKKRGKTKVSLDDDEPEFESRREVEVTKEQEKKARLRARDEARKERKKLLKERKKERKKAKKERDRERKARIRARKRGIRTPRDTTSRPVLENEPEDLEEEQDLGPVGMISIFDDTNADGANSDEPYGKKSGSYVVKHRPAFQEIRLWLAWAYIKRDNFDRANLILQDLRANRGTFPDVRRKAMAVQAFLYLEQDRLEEAIPYLEEAAEVAESRNERARFHYIAGQLYQELGRPSGAAQAFQNAIAARPSYDLELGARLNLAQNDFLAGTGSAAEAIKRMEKMARDDKNADYVARILFSASAIAMRDGDDQLGGELLQRALKEPSAGPTERSEAYKLLGDLAYAERDYRAAKLYYDTTLTTLSRGDERYADLESRRDLLSPASDAMNDIELKDSLLRIGMLPEDKRRDWATTLFERRRALAARPVPPVGRNNTGAPVVSTNSDFWAYEPQRMKRAQRDFQRTWGDRPLRDNWRLGSRAAMVDFNDPGDVGGSEDPAEPAMITEGEIEEMLSGIPVSPADQKTTQLQLAESMFKLGKEYREQIDDPEKALAAFEALDERFPESNFEAESYYYQYLIHKQMGNATKAGVFARKLKDRFYGSKFERLANDPSYAAKLAAKDGELEREYAAAYAAFDAGQYKQANELAVAGRKKVIGQNPVKARYDLLIAMTTGHLQGREAYIAALQQVTQQHDGTPEATRAREIMRLLGRSGARVPGQVVQGGGGNFKPSFEELHYVLVVFTEPGAAINDAKINISKYNNKYAKLDRLRLTNMFLGQENNTPVLVMRRFRSGELAQEYVKQATEKEQEFLSFGEYDYTLFSVSQTNYREILKARSAEGYAEWYAENYQ